MNEMLAFYKFLITFLYLFEASSCSCPVLECWFVHEKTGRGGGPAGNMNQEKSLLKVRTDPRRPWALKASHSDPERVYYVTDPGEALCDSALQSRKGSAHKPKCEINPFLPQPATVQWAASLTESGLSPIYLQADWFSAALEGTNGQLVMSSIMRAVTATKEPNVILSVTTKQASVQARLGEPTVLDCNFWVDRSSPISELGFAVEWRYQFRGKGRMILAYDGPSDRLADGQEVGTTLDFAALHAEGNASLILQEAKVGHSGTYICTVYLPHITAQVAMDLQVVEPPTLSLHPSSLPLSLPGQVVRIQCEASRFCPLSLELSWELRGASGGSRALGQGSLTGQRQAWDGTYVQSSTLELDPSRLDLGRGGEVVCVAVHLGGTRRANVTLNIIGVSAPSIEDSMAMVAVALGLYGLIKVVSWTLLGSGDAGKQEKKDQ